MFFKMSCEFCNNIKRLLGEIYTEDELLAGLNAFENLINIDNESSNFNQEYGEFLNKTDLLSKEWDVISGCRLEGFLRKIEVMKGNNVDVDGIMLQGYYTRIGFYVWLNEPVIQTARAQDKINANNISNKRGGEGFHLAEADAAQYRGCPHHIENYIIAYQLRNKTKAHDNPMIEDFVVRIEKIKSLFIVYMDQCIINADLINSRYEEELVTNRINYKKYAKDHIDQIGDFEKNFLQLDWQSNQDKFNYDFIGSVKFIGEAGMGKTTQMKKMYLELLRLVEKGEYKKIPVWINLSELCENQDSSLENEIRAKLIDCEQYYSLLLKSSTIVLFLDGYNEILTKDAQDLVKRKLAGDIDDIHKMYPEVLIAMTDRVEKSNPPCLTKNVKIYKFAGFKDNEITEYIELKVKGELRDKILNYMKEEKSNWITQTLIIPAKLNSLIELINEGIFPENEDEFYDNYLEFILEREANEKKETRIEDLKYLLYILAQDLNSPSDEKNQNEIIKLWLSEGQVGDLPEARRLFKLATEFPILVPGIGEKTFRFAYSQYYHKMYEGL